VASRRLPLSWIFGATAVALLAAAAVVVVAGAGSGDDGSGGQASDEPGELELASEGELPESVHAVRLGSLDGGPERSLHELMDGRPIVVNFFASWCQPCIEEMPAFEQAHQALGDDVAFVGMALRDQPANAREIVATTGVTYPTFADPDDAALTYFGGVNMPTTVFLAPDGEILEVMSRPLTQADLEAKLVEHYGLSTSPAQPEGH
jgi:cytochrome c biogenesis protein CcmG/thiol:disulfide interchange protein DsbE